MPDTLNLSPFIVVLCYRVSGVGLLDEILGVCTTFEKAYNLLLDELPHYQSEPFEEARIEQFETDENGNRGYYHCWQYEHGGEFIKFLSTED